MPQITTSTLSDQQYKEQSKQSMEEQLRQLLREQGRTKGITESAIEDFIAKEQEASLAAKQYNTWEMF